MVRVINAANLKGELYQFEILNGRFSAVSQQPHRQTHAGSLLLEQLDEAASYAQDRVFDAEGALILPAGIDAHVHSRDPGLSHKETWGTLAQGAYRGGVVAVADMPNTLPPTMTRTAILEKAEIAAASGLRFQFYLGVGAANINKVGELLRDSALPLCGLKVYYGQSTGELMYDDLNTLGRALPEDGSKIISFHSEDQCTVDCNLKRLGQQLHHHDNRDYKVHSQIRSSEAAHQSTKAILEWGSSYGRPIHIAHLSTPVEVELIAEAKAKGVKVTSEVAPHHLLFSEDDYERLGPYLKMNPPVRTRKEVEALKRFVGQGAIEVFATDHAPHTHEEKRATVGRSPSGVPGVELFYPLLFKVAQLTGLSWEEALNMGSLNPAQLFGFKDLGKIAPGFLADFVNVSRTSFIVKDEEVVAKCGWTPYAGLELPCRVIGTWQGGKKVYFSL